jgi:D-alanyl-D-alanine carboxypeptidase (penicillin-binding protein 5/6)
VKKRRTGGAAYSWRAFAGVLACLIGGLAAESAAPALAGIPGANATVVGGSQLSGRGIIVNYPASGAPRMPAVPAVPASAYVVADAGTGQVLAAKDPHGWFAPASTLKVLTAVTLMPALNPDATVVASRQAAIVEPNKVGLIAGHRYRVSDLFKALLLISANDAAVSLAQATGSFARGMALMNAEALRLGADDTVAVQPNGLDASGQHVSAYDEALFARQALKLPLFMRDEQLLTARFPLGRRNTVTLYNQNTMLTDYPGDLGGKIGWTTPAGATFIGLARRHGVTLIVTILHCRPTTEMTYAARLLNWGFALDGQVAPIGTLVSPQPARGAQPRPPGPQHRAAPGAAAQGHPRQLTSPTVPVAAAVGSVLLGAAVFGAFAAVSRRNSRRSRAGSRLAP